LIAAVLALVYWLSTDIQTPKRKHKHIDSINNVGQGWKGSKRSANNHPNRYSTLETSTSQYVSKQLARDVKSVSTGRLFQGLTTCLLKKIVTYIVIRLFDKQFITMTTKAGTI